MNQRWALPAFLFFAAGLPLAAQLRDVETDDLRLVFYDANHTYLAPQLMRSFQNAFNFHKKLFGYQPKQKVTVLLEDFGDFGHGGADVIPSDRISFGIAPLSYIYETIPANERTAWMMNHELAHVFEMDGTGGSDGRFRKVFGGKVMPNDEDPISMFYGFLTAPRRYSPRWYHEGTAVFLETWMSGGLGRTLGGYDEMAFRAMVRDKSKIFDVVGLEAEGTAIDFQIGVNSYLYGARFLTYLAEQHGPQKVIDWVSRRPGTHAYFSREFKAVYGNSLGAEWSRWIERERDWQNDNLAAIRQYPVTPLHRIIEQPLGSVSKPHLDPETGLIYAAVRYPGKMAHIAAIDPAKGTLEHLQDVEGAALFYVCSMAFDPKARKLYYTTDNNDWRDLNEFDLKTHKARRVLNNFRAGDLVLDQTTGSIWAVRHTNGISVLIETPPPYKMAVTRIAFPYGMDLYDLDISPDGKWMSAAIADSSGRQKLTKISMDDARAGNIAFGTIHDFDFNSAAGFVFSPDGKYLYGTSYYTGASNIFRFDAASSAMDVLSNAETGLFWPTPMPDGKLLAFEYTSRGFEASTLDIKPIEDVTAVKYLGQQIVEKYPLVKEWKLPPPAEIDVSAATRSAGTYTTWREMKFSSIYPVVQGYKDTASYGMRADFADGLGLATLHLTAGYSPGSTLGASERGHASVEFHNWGLNFTGYYNNADFYDLFGPTKVSRKGYGAKVAYKKNLLYKPPRTLDLDWSLAAYGGIDQLPDYQNIASTVHRFLEGKMSLTYTRFEKSLGAVDDEKGVMWKVTAQGNAAHSDFFPRIYGQYDFGFLTPLRNSPVWIRMAAGKSHGDRTDPFANFYFGGFGNNYVDHQSINRYREYYSFPGVQIDQIDATDFAKALVEWNLPPVHFSRFGATYLYCNWVRVTLFSSVLGGNLASAPDRVVYGNAGAQADFRIVISSYLNTTFSAGFAEARDKSGRSSPEVMISLKLL